MSRTNTISIRNARSIKKYEISPKCGSTLVLNTNKDVLPLESILILLPLVSTGAGASTGEGVLFATNSINLRVPIFFLADIQSTGNIKKVVGKKHKDGKVEDKDGYVHVLNGYKVRRGDSAFTTSFLIPGFNPDK